MMRLFKWWFDRNPYIPAILKPVDPVVIDNDLERATAAVDARLERAALASKASSLSVVSLHESFLKSLEGKRA